MKENAIMHINALVASRKKTLQCSRRRQKPFLMQDLRVEREREGVDADYLNKRSNSIQRGTRIIKSTS